MLGWRRLARRGDAARAGGGRLALRAALRGRRARALGAGIVLRGQPAPVAAHVVQDVPQRLLHIRRQHSSTRQAAIAQHTWSVHGDLRFEHKLLQRS